MPLLLFIVSVYALIVTFTMMPLGVKLLVLSPLFWPLGKLLWAVYKRLGWEIRRRRVAGRSRRVA